MKLTANILSVIFHPSLMPSLGLLIIFNTGTYISYLPFEIKRLIFYVILISTALLPLITVPVLKFQNVIRDLSLNDRKERIIPMIFTLIFYAFAAILLLRFSVVPRFIQLSLLACAVSILFALLISIRWKISIHMLGIGGLTGIVFGLIKLNAANIHMYIIMAILASGLLGFSRLFLNAHKPAQVYVGFLTGFATVFGTLYFFT